MSATSAVLRRLGRVKAVQGTGQDMPVTAHRLVWVRLVWVLLAGVAMGLAFQPYNLWPLLAVAIPLLTLVVRDVRPRQAFALGYVFGVAMLTVSISWVHVLGIWVAVALVAFESLFFGGLGLLLQLTAGLRAWPLAGACAWALTEYAYSRIPFGGFGWTRAAYAAVDTPLAGYLPLLGVAGLSFVVALAGQLLAWLWLRVRSERALGRPPHRSPALVGVLAGVTLLGSTGAALHLFQVEPMEGRAGSLNVGIVQGNVPGRGLAALGRARTVTSNHLNESVRLVTRARLGAVPQPDFLLWPENSTDIDPLRDPVTREVVQSAAEVAGVPVLVGAVMAGPGPEERQTTALWWDPDAGVVARYDKRNLVPFGEWIPFRDQLRPLIPILEQVGAQSVPGTVPGVLKVPFEGGTLRVGDVICFELAYDDTIYETITGGAEISVVQSNNATYGGTGQIEQQFAITRARAMETRREIAVATTNSVSGFIDRNGRVVARTAEFTAASMVVTMPRRAAVTPAVRVAPWLDRLAAAGAVAFLLTALWGRRPKNALAAHRPKQSVGSAYMQQNEAADVSWHPPSVEHSRTPVKRKVR
jgi:apolipoprotein N-acyltransferase